MHLHFTILKRFSLSNVQYSAQKAQNSKPVTDLKETNPTLYLFINRTICKNFNTFSGYYFFLGINKHIYCPVNFGI